MSSIPIAHVIDVDSGNLQSLKNAIEKLGFEVKTVSTKLELESCLTSCQRLFLPGVGNFGHFMSNLNERQLAPGIISYINSGKPLMGICVGLQALFEGSAEDSEKGLGVIPGILQKFNDSNKSVPHIGWNNLISVKSSQPDTTLYEVQPSSRFYYVNSYAAVISNPYQGTFDDLDQLTSKGWDFTVTQYKDQNFVSSVAKDGVFATQFHPEKSGEQGLKVLEAFLKGERYSPIRGEASKPGLTSRIVACLDVRTNDSGDLVVTKGDQYDVRERKTDGQGNPVRNLGKPVDMARRYYEQGADEVTFLNITSFRNSPLADLPMLQVLRMTSKYVFVPLTIGGGIRDLVDPITGKTVPALEVAHEYFRSGADKVSIGSDAVIAAEQYYSRGKKGDGKSPIETISKAYGAQAVVISVDPKRVYVKSPQETTHKVIETQFPGPNGEKYVWYQCTIRGGREVRDLGVYEFVQAVEALGAGELLLNCIDRDGTNSGFDLELINMAKSAVHIPVIASSGAGNPEHFYQVFTSTNTDAALGAGMFHRGEYTIKQVKDYISARGLLCANHDLK